MGASLYFGCLESPPVEPAAGRQTRVPLSTWIPPTNGDSLLFWGSNSRAHARAGGRCRGLTAVDDLTGWASRCTRWPALTSRCGSTDAARARCGLECCRNIQSRRGRGKTGSIPTTWAASSTVAAGSSPATTVKSRGTQVTHSEKDCVSVCSKSIVLGR